ncbi:MAG: ABC transporter permease [Alphaproteobacteria bacterium]|nr:ABC transporter permease [Alphaproteobacteria bacterium]
MITFTLSRLIQSAFVLLIMSFVIYVLLGLMPGDPIDLMIGADPNVTAADVARLKALQGLDRPILERYGAWLENAVVGDFGYSRLFAKPVLEVLGPRLLNSLVLMSISLLVALTIAIPAGIHAARRPGSWTDQVINLLCFAGISVPPFWLALLLILFFAVSLGALPASGMGTIGENGLLDRLPYMVLPILTLSAAGIAGYTRHVRAAMIEVLCEDYIRTARAKGVGEGRVVWRHALHNALLPVVTIVALDFGSLFSGALVTETMFSWLGMGKTIYDAVMGNDYNLALVGLLLATGITLLANILADIAYVWLDPRIHYRVERGA